MLLGLVLLYVGAVLFLNGIWMLGRIGDREIVVINVVTGVVATSVAVALAFGAGADAGSIREAALTLLFATTYFWVAHNRLSDVDGRGLGWFSLFVAVTVVPVTVEAAVTARGLTGAWLAFNWACWAVLWFMYFLLLARQRPILRATAWVTLLSGIVNGWIPGYLLLEGWLGG
ncbi:MAG TPA: AmiS/UreI family transporter [Amaricoccus sp.]|uniref:AmiS/UreI family transporter n=1 Tax=Amaricoccus sp. TaxID=1872485 RepID=UPI002C4FB469|nr:AmiS/UreI family transporter [Amaricoccus sp.]HMQ94918.1 AmiS/UreI family transporter [Amaricoccus sp.]HMR53707.1 AmiS/UreI family transporter [Amaricoccus sp.]HMR59766.1 AmiS/UreI family transporter [Amaricoccus sp.]HMT98952.1 AmiS/UreI family transporter [Amaricoccus sp.]